MIIVKKIRRSLALFAVAAAVTSGQHSANADELDDYLFATFEDAGFSMRSIESEPPRQAWMSDPELRIAPERDEFDRSSQTYSLRFRPTSRKERRAIEALSRIDDRLADARWDRTVTGVLAERYHRVIDLAWYEVSTALANQRLLLDRSLLVSEQMLSATSNFDAGRLQSTAIRVDLREQEVRQAELRAANMRSSTISDYLAIANEKSPAVSAHILRPAMISSWLERIDSTPVSASHVGKITSLEIDRASQQLALQGSRSGFGLRLMEISYEDKITDSYNVTFGFQLPFGQDRNGAYRRARELSTARRESFFAEKTFAEDLSLAIRDIRWQIESYDAVSVALGKIRTHGADAGSDANAIAELRVHELDLLESAARKHIQLLHDFVDLLEMTGQLRPESRSVRTNWIRRNIS